MRRSFRTAPGSKLGLACKHVALAAILAIGLFVMQPPALAHQAGAEAGSGQASQAAAPDEAVRPDDEPSGPAAKAAGMVSNTAAIGEAGELSLKALIKRADLIVQLVMGVLVACSLICWTVFLSKIFELGRARRRLATALCAIEDVRFLGDGVCTQTVSNAILGTLVLERLVEAALKEKRLSDGLAADGTVVDRYLTRAGEIVRAEARRIVRGTGLLATIGATAPFIGLFGTVWGIMNSFIGISRAQTTNLAVVAPGIAEALLATATGLVAAIPAVIFYNLLARGIKAYIEQVSEGSGMVVRLLSRDLARPDRVYAVHAAE